MVERPFTETKNQETRAVPGEATPASAESQRARDGPAAGRTAPSAPSAPSRSSPPNERTQHGFRGDVEGLRAVAIGVVLAYHAGAATVPGGYVGVDIFFVISGFLITGLLVRELERDGTISLSRFFARRVRRLLPPVVVVLTAVVLAAWLLMSPVERKSVFGDVIAAALYVVNWQQAAQAVDYSALGTEASPVQHFWSLAVEEQFYLAWPLILLGIAWWTLRRRHGARALRARLAAALAVIGVVSFVHSVQLTGQEAGAAYFSTATRGWELAVGGLLALVPAARWRGWPHRLPGAVAVTGLAFILVAVLAFDDATRFPGPAAMLPVLGAAAVIAAGTASTRTSAARLLSVAPVRYVGRISYSWYLWHWPAIVFATVWASGLSTPLLLFVVALSWVPAALTHWLVEEPMRRYRALAPTRRALTLGAACTLAPVLIAAGSWAAVPTVPLASAGQAPGAEVLRKGAVPQESAEALRPSPEEATKDRGQVHSDGCLVDQPGTESGDCVYGDPTSDTTVVLFGDSHAMQYTPALDTIAHQRGWRLIVLTKSACTPARVTVYNSQLKRAYTECDTWRENSLRRIADEKPALVITGNQPTATVMDAGRKLDGPAGARAMTEGYIDTMRTVRRGGAELITLADNPHPPEDIPSCVSKSLDSLTDCAFSKSSGLDFEPVNKEAAGKVRGARLIDPAPVLCPDGTCAPVIGNVLVYRNGAHITATYMRTMLDWLDTALPSDI